MGQNSALDERLKDKFKEGLIALVVSDRTGAISPVY